MIKVLVTVHLACVYQLHRAKFFWKGLHHSLNDHRFRSTSSPLLYSTGEKGKCTWSWQLGSMDESTTGEPSQLLNG